MFFILNCIIEPMVCIAFLFCYFIMPWLVLGNKQVAASLMELQFDGITI
jgi:hypothetical protein